MLLNVISGNFAVSKKSGEFKCLSRPSLFVLIEAALIVKATEDASGLAWSIWIVPSKSVKLPRTLETKWRTWKVTSEWTLSTV